MTPEQLNELAALEAKATPGPWEAGDTFIRDDYTLVAVNQHVYVGAENLELSYEDAELIAAIRNSAPELIAEIKRHQWQPITTAPKDGQAVLLFCDDGRIEIGLYARITNNPHWHEIYNTWEWKSREGGYSLMPTNWMPLPEPLLNTEGDT